MSSISQPLASDLRAFVPGNAVDAHAHWFARVIASPPIRHAMPVEQADFGRASYGRCVGSWMADRVPSAGVFFGLPVRDLNRKQANAFVRHELDTDHASRGLLLVGPGDDPAAIEEQVIREGWAGLKPYHLFAECPNTYEAELHEYLPDWCWEIANRHELAIMLHLVRSRALADESNQQALHAGCRRYPHAKVVLAHAGRGFCSRHTVEGAASLVGFDNIYFDTSAICEPLPLETILRLFGPGRLLFGTDFPVSQIRGRCVSVGDGFAWLDEQTMDWEKSPFAKPEQVGLESLVALQQACQLADVTDSGIERIFCDNARHVFTMTAESDHAVAAEIGRSTSSPLSGRAS